MKRLSLYCAALALLGCLEVARAEDIQGTVTTRRPVITIGATSYQQFASDLSKVMPATGQDGIGIEALLQMATGGNALASLDKKKPWGATLFLQGDEFGFLAFVPTKDPVGLINGLGGLVSAPREIGDGLWETRLQGSQLFIKQSGDWSYIAASAEGLRDLPEDPTSLLAGLNQQYDLAASVRPDGLGESVEPGLKEMQKVLDAGLSRRYRGETDAQLQRRREIAGENAAWVRSLLSDLKAATLGLDLDGKTGQAIIEGHIAAREGSEMARSLTPTPSATRFAGFAAEDAALSVNQSGTGMADVLALAAMGADAMIQTVIEQLGEGEEGGDQELAATIATRTGELFEEAMSRGSSDIGFSLQGVGPFTLVAGTDLGDEAKVAAVAQEIKNKLGDRLKSGDVELHEEGGLTFVSTYVKLPERVAPPAGNGGGFPFQLFDPEALRGLDGPPGGEENDREGKAEAGEPIEGAERDADDSGDRITNDDDANDDDANEDDAADDDAMPLEGDLLGGFRDLMIPQIDPREAAIEQVRSLLGDEFPVVVAHGNGCCYVAAGGQALKRLKTAIAASAKQTDAKVYGVRATVRPLRLLRSMAAADPQNLMLSLMVMMGGGQGDDDRIRFYAQPAEGGAKYRLEAEAGAVRLLPLAAIYLISSNLGGGGGFAP